MLEAEIGDLSRQLDDMSNQMTVESAQRLKQQIYKDTYARGAVQGAANDTKKAAARTFKDAVNEAEPSVKALNAEESKLLNVLDVAEGRALKPRP
jgi:chemotaxis regulatin CheY-phosphate phosphatase CheZ